MPHINVIIPGSNTSAIAALTQNKTKIRFVLHKLFGYTMQEIALIPRILTMQEEYLADNIMPTEMVIDIGAKPDLHVGDPYASQYRDLLLEKCPAYTSLHFGVWIREMPRNGFSEHVPTKRH